MKRLRVVKPTMLRQVFIFSSFLVFIFLLNFAKPLQAQDGKIWHDASGNHKPYIDPQINHSMTKLVKNTLPAVVSIATEQMIRMRGLSPNAPMNQFFDFFFNNPQGGRKLRQQGMGSGFIISPKGYILTNNHVIENADEITVQLNNGEEYLAKVVGRDARTDLALLKVDPGKKLPYLVLGNSDALDIGHTVIAMGNPFGLSHTVTKGIVSQMGRKDIAPSGRKIIANFIQTDASINPGNSGGPLLNIFGEVVGINTAISQGQGIGFAIPVNMAKTLLPQLATGKIERSWIGIQLQNISPALAETLGLKNNKGCLITGVVPKSPAKKAGLKAEDVILEFNGHKIENSADLSWMASTTGSGKRVVLTVWRDRKKIEISLKLGKMPGGVSGQESSGEDKKTVEVFGLKLGNPSAEQLDKAGIMDGKGVVVLALAHGSKAARSGIRSGDIIRKVNTSKIKNMQHFLKTVNKYKQYKIVRLFINRNGQALFIAFPTR